jgi:hypothetical protein
MVHTVSRDMARFAIWSHSYIQIGHDMDNNPAEATTKQLESHSNQGCMAKEIKQLDEILQQRSPFAVSYRLMHQIEYMNE